MELYIKYKQQHVQRLEVTPQPEMCLEALARAAIAQVDSALAYESVKFILPKGGKSLLPARDPLRKLEDAGVQHAAALCTRLCVLQGCWPRASMTSAREAR